ncbi:MULTISPECIES: ATP-dependent zinc protease family protein [Alkalimonas]|uniref:ATP-dependent zinc protease n=1 Tax=Alkalimonas mucilaginosa TaxID=3057676 RepID=A0ABU7JED0_9GAMM|nr:ATP-dependent zinc protease [Alkalimonas sp. MEB004]MEE2023718.1 ATP-dependent zinc protease [Alkalimonas sp. MEB004]
MNKSDVKARPIGWREWVALPELQIPAIKCKVDTGARSSALHTFSVEPFQKEGEEWVRFGMHPRQHDTEQVVWCEAKVHDKRAVTDSGGHTTERYFIKTEVVVGQQSYPIEVSLTSRDSMLFRMLLGREALRHRFVVVPEASYLQPLSPIEQCSEKVKPV